MLKVQWNTLNQATNNEQGIISDLKKSVTRLGGFYMYIKKMTYKLQGAFTFSTK